MSMKKTFRRLLPHALALGILGVPFLVSAQQFVPLADVSPSSKLSQLYSTQGGDLSNFINSLFTFTLAAGAMAAVLRLAYAGYLYMGQADMWSHKGQAKTIIGDVTLGLLLLLGIYLILYQINPDIVKLNGIQQIQANPVQSVTGGGASDAPAATQQTSAFTPQTCVATDPTTGVCTAYQQ